MFGKVRAPLFKDAVWIQGEAFEIDPNASYVTLLDFWTFGCINCLNVLPDLKKLESEFGTQIRIVSVHTPKFSKEGDDETLSAVIKTLGINHYVIQDREAKLWDRYAVKAWPSWVLIDPKGYVVMHERGEKQYELFRNKILEYSIAGHSVSQEVKQKSLVAVDSLGDYLAVATAQYVTLYKDENKVFQSQGFSRISALTLTPNALYISDREAQTVTRIRLDTFDQSILLDNLRAPWGLDCHQDKLYIALAGSHQLMAYSLVDKQSHILTGNRFEGLRDGCDETVMLAQPSSVVWDYDRLWFVDAESSSLRYLHQGCVTTVIGEGLFDFGDDNTSKLLQHPQSITLGKIEDGCGAGRIFIADTYNDKIKLYDPIEQSIMTLLEDIYMPISIAKNGCRLFIVSLGDSYIRSFDIKTMQLETLELE